MIVSCTDCAQKNRVPTSRLHQQAKCGRCQKPIGPIATPISVGSVDEFDELIQGASVPVLVDFWAAWCAPCRMAAPHIEAVSRAEAGNALVLKVDTEALPILAQRYGIQGIPNFVVFRGGRVVRQQAGVVDTATMQGWLRAA